VHALGPQVDRRAAGVKWPRGPRRAAWLLIVIADVGILLWGAMAALAPEHLLGPEGAPILPAGYEGFSGGSWPELGPAARGFMEVLFRAYGAYNVAFGLLAIAIAATAYRRGERWAWWALLVGNRGLTF
jgi:hypothetical protein